MEHKGRQPGKIDFMRLLTDGGLVRQRRKRGNWRLAGVAYCLLKLEV